VRRHISAKARRRRTRPAPFGHRAVAYRRWGRCLTGTRLVPARASC
jgi:hypothetical protein